LAVVAAPVIADSRAARRLSHMATPLLERFAKRFVSTCSRVQGESRYDRERELNKKKPRGSQMLTK